MKLLRAILILTTIFLITSCSEEEPDFIGSYTAVSLQDDCPDSSQNTKVDRTSDGICLISANEVECIEITLIIEPDGTYAITTQRSQKIGGIEFSQAPVTDMGTYVTEGRTITLQGGTSATFELNEAETSLNWFITETTAGCRRSYTLTK